jgi:Fe-S-cluster containining protein
MKSKKLSYTGYRAYRLSLDKPGSDHLSPPCGDCSACCKHYKDIILQDDELEVFGWKMDDTPTADGRQRLKMKEDGSCIYLSDRGCSIYEQRPIACRHFDCRDFAMTGIQPSDKNGNISAVGMASVRMAEQTLTAKRRKDHVMLGAIRMAAFEFANKTKNHTAETCAVAGLGMAEIFVPIVDKFLTELDQMKHADPQKYQDVLEGLGQFMQQTAGKHINDMLSSCQP